MAIQVQGANGTPIWADDTPKAERVILYDSNGNPLVQTSGANVPANPGFLAIGGRNDGAWRGARMDRYGSLRVGNDQMLFSETCEGAALNYQLWAPVFTTWTVPTQASPAGINIGAGATAAASKNAQLISARQFPKYQGAPLRARFRKKVNFAGITNIVVDFGFGTPSAATPIVSPGAYWRYNSNGSVTPVIAYGGSEITGTDISSSLVNTNYYTWDIIVDDDVVTFICQDTSTGRSISEQVLQMPLTQSKMWDATHLPVFDRLYSTGGAPSSAPTAVSYLSDCYVMLYDALRNNPFANSQSALGLNNLVSPTAYTPVAVWANGAAPGNATMTASTAPATANLGGLFQFAMIAAAESDYPMFAFQVPAPYTFYCTGVHIGQMVVLSLTTGLTAPVVANWGAAFNSSAASLATTTSVGSTYIPNRVAIGTQYLGGVAVATIGTGIGPDLDWHPQTPQVCLPGRFVHAILRLPVVGALGSACVVRGSVTFDGFFE